MSKSGQSIEYLHRFVDRFSTHLSQDERDEANRVIAQLLARLSGPIPMRLHCPARNDDGSMCGFLHVDAGEFLTNPHHTHACQKCGHTWRPAKEHTVGVQFIPGFRDEQAATSAQSGASSDHVGATRTDSREYEAGAHPNPFAPSWQPKIGDWVRDGATPLRLHAFSKLTGLFGATGLGDEISYPRAQDLKRWFPFIGERVQCIQLLPAPAFGTVIRNELDPGPEGVFFVVRLESGKQISSYLDGLAPAPPADAAMTRPTIKPGDWVRVVRKDVKEFDQALRVTAIATSGWISLEGFLGLVDPESLEPWTPRSSEFVVHKASQVRSRVDRMRFPPGTDVPLWHLVNPIGGKEWFEPSEIEPADAYPKGDHSHA